MRKLALLALLLVGACGSTTAPDDRWAIPENIDYADALEIDLAAMNKTESGLYWKDLVTRTDGRGVVLDDVIRFHYTIWHPDGSTIETSRGSAPRQSAVLLLIPGLAEGITGVSATGATQDMPAMHEGGMRKLVIRPELAWPNGRGAVPPRTTLVYEVEILALL
jgi:FKBP-type peptidyl-prolyl cis-trans isomerase FkpA